MAGGPGAALAGDRAVKVRERATRVDGLAVRYLEAGEGDALLLLHGGSLGSSADVWEPVHVALAGSGFRVIAPDEPGFGRSDIPADASRAYARAFTLRLLDAVGISSAHLVGHSRSGAFAVWTALERPERALTVVVVGTASLLPALPGAAAGGDAEEAFASEPTLEDVRRLLERNVHDVSAVTPDRVRHRHEASVGRNFAAHLARARAAREPSSGPPLRDRLGELAVPALFLYGAADRDAAARAPLLAERFPRLAVRVLEGCGHLVHWDAPERFVDAVAAFAHGTR